MLFNSYILSLISIISIPYVSLKNLYASITVSRLEYMVPRIKSFKSLASSNPFFLLGFTRCQAMRSNQSLQVFNYYGLNLSKVIQANADNKIKIGINKIAIS